MSRPEVKRGPDRETFCRVWQNGNSVAEVASELGMETSSAMSRAAYYRKQGVQLKHYPKGRRKLPMEEERSDHRTAEFNIDQHLLRRILACLLEIKEF